MKRKFYLTFLMAIVMMMMFPLKMAAEESTEPATSVGYAVFNSADGTLTFKYGVKPETGADGETLYDLNEGANLPGWFDNRSSITKVVFDKSFQNARPTTCYYWFAGCSSLASIEGIENLNTSEVTVMSYMFEYCQELKSLDLSNFNTSNVTDMNGMFNGCAGLTSLDLSSFNTSNVTGMNGMFCNCTGLTFINLSKFDTSNVTEMYQMFYGCTGLTTLDLSNFDTSNVTLMIDMFYGCTGLTTLDLSSFNTSKVTNMSGMFNSCSNLTTIYVSDKFTTDNTVTQGTMFQSCTKLEGAVSFKGNVVGDIKYANYLTGYFKTYYTQNGEKTELYGDINYYSDYKQYDIDTRLNFTDGDIVTNVSLVVSNGISYTRTMTNEWGTLCLPFDVKYTSNESYKLYELTEATAEALTFTEYTDGSYISPGTPMAIKRISKTDDKVTIFADENFVKTSLSNPTNESAWRLVGTYSTADVPDEGYVISQNAFWNVKGLKDEGQNIKRVRVNGYRAYIMPLTTASEAPSGAARMLSIIAPDGEPSSIDDINAVFSGEATYYDLNGRRIDSLQQGVNIVKIGNRTKKVIIK